MANPVWRAAHFFLALPGHVQGPAPTRPVMSDPSAFRALAGNVAIPGDPRGPL